MSYYFDRFFQHMFPLVKLEEFYDFLPSLLPLVKIDEVAMKITTTKNCAKSYKFDQIRKNLE